MKSGYHQVEIEEDHKQRTAFTVGQLGFFEFNRLPFGLCNSPATYQRLMEECLGDLNMKICVIYLDDLIVFGKTFQEQIERLEIIFNRLRDCCLKLATKKCVFCQEKVKYVGFIVSEQGIEVDPDKVQKVVNWPRPNNPDDVRQFVGFAGFYRRFIHNFSKIVKPLNELMPKGNAKKKRKPTTPPGWTWTEQHESAFNKMKELLTTAPILAYADYDEPFEIHTDASGEGIGAVLYQKQDQQWRVISYASRTLSKSEKNYPTMKLEFLALKWAVTEKFSDYLYGNRFRVVTDNNPLTYVLTTAKLDATGQRWIAALAAFDFEISYKPGKNNTDADALSRYPLRPDNICPDSIAAICKATQPQPLATSLAPDIDIMEVAEATGQPLAQIEIRQLRRKQQEDPVLGFWLTALKDKKLPPRNRFSNDRDNMTMYRNFGNFVLLRGLLYREVTVNEEKKRQLVLPEVYRQRALEGTHDEMGHPGRERTTGTLKDRFYWPGMTADTERWIKKCDRCIRRKSSTNIRAPLVSITSSYPLELVCMDFLSLEPSKGGIENVLVITDHFTKFSVAVPTRNQTAKTTAEALYRNFILPYGIPAKIHSDQGANFESDLIKELCETLGMKKSRTTAYHPMSNGITERFNRTLIGMLGTLETEKKADWKQHISTLVQAYNSTRHETTGFSPFELMFGRKPRLPVDLVFGLDDTADEQSTSDYVKQLKDSLHQAFKKVKDSSDKARSKQKEYFDEKARASKLEVGDKVLVKILAFRGRHKLADKFEEEVYEVIKQPNTDIPVYVVKSENSEKTLHRNHLLPVKTKKDERPKPAPRKAVSKVETPVPIPRTRKGTDDEGKDDSDGLSPQKELEVEPEQESDVEMKKETVVDIEEILEEKESTDSESDQYVTVTYASKKKKRRIEEELSEVEETNREETHKAIPVPLPRRSGRRRRPPDRYGEYVMAMNKKEESVGVLKSLLHTGCLQKMSGQMADNVVDGIFS